MIKSEENLDDLWCRKTFLCVKAVSLSYAESHNGNMLEWAQAGVQFNRSAHSGQEFIYPGQIFEIWQKKFPQKRLSLSDWSASSSGSETILDFVSQMLRQFSNMRPTTGGDMEPCQRWRSVHAEWLLTCFCWKSWLTFAPAATFSVSAPQRQHEHQ